MADHAAEPQTTPQDGSLEAAATAFEGILARQQTDTKDPKEAQPEPVKAKDNPTPDPKQAPAAPASEPTGSEQETKEEVQPVKLWKVKVDNDELEVPEEELLKGYSRTADYTRKTQELAKQRKEFEEGELKVARERRDQQEALLGELKAAIQSITPTEPNWDDLKAKLPPEQFADRVLEWRERQDTLSKITAEQQRIAAEKEAEAVQGFQAYVTEQRAHLERELPEFKDPEKGPALQKDLSAFAKTRGFTDEELAQVVDHRVVLLLHDAMMGRKALDAAKQKAADIKTKVEKSIEAAAPGTGQPEAKRSAKDDAFLKAAKSGRPEDAAKFFEHLVQ